jgi:hypothetical protein
MTTALLDDWAVAPSPRNEVHGAGKASASLRKAYVVSGVMDRAVVINGATLDPKGEQVSRVSFGHGAVSATIAHELVRHSFTEVGPFLEVVVGSWISGGAEGIGADNALFTDSRIRRVLGPISAPNQIDVGVTCFYGLASSIARILRWAEPAHASLQTKEEGYSWSAVHRLMLGTAPRPATPTDSKTNAKWLKTNSSQYAGLWIALRDGQLLGTEPSRADLTRRLRAEHQLAGAFLVSLKN